MNFNPYDFTYPSRRNIVYGKHGMVATSQQSAAQVGIEILKDGGNAIDAAIAMAITLTVVEPTCNGIGGDAFALIWHENKLYGLNASGPSGSLANIDAMKEKGFETMPSHGIETVTVPGAPSAWIALSRKYGKLPFKDLFSSAIAFAESGFAVPSIVSSLWKKEVQLHTSKHKNDPSYNEWFKLFAPDGQAPEPGDIFYNPLLGNTLRELAETECESFYRGNLAEKIIENSEKWNGFLTKEDLAEYYPEWVEPLCVNYRGYDVWELPPNGHGIVALMALNILKGFDFEERECVDAYHKSIEALKLAYSDAKRYVTDPRCMSVTAKELLSEEYAQERRKLIGNEALIPFPGSPKKGGTVYLCAADDDGNMVSYIQSNYSSFGSGMVIPGTGIALHNRGKEFSLNIEDENCLQPKKKPYHTIIPGFLTKDGKALGPFGVMGAYMQPQGHLQVVQNLIDFHLNPQQALNVPRWQWIGDKKILVENEFPEEIVLQLKALGHEVEYSDLLPTFGRGQIILCTENGVYAGGTEPRADGAVLGF